MADTCIYYFNIKNNFILLSVLPGVRYLNWKSINKNASSCWCFVFRPIKCIHSLVEQEAMAQFGSLRRLKEEIQTLTWSQLRKWHDFPPAVESSFFGVLSKPGSDSNNRHQEQWQQEVHSSNGNTFDCPLSTYHVASLPLSPSPLFISWYIFMKKTGFLFTIDF